MTKLYFAGPLFSQAEWQWNAAIAAALRQRGLHVLLPQERARPMLFKTEPFNPSTLFRANTAAIDEAEVVVAILDGADPDSGTSWECGYAFRRGRPVVGVRTDIRVGGDGPNLSVNLMLSEGCAKLIGVPLDRRDDPSWVVDKIEWALKSLLP